MTCYLVPYSKSGRGAEMWEKSASLVLDEKLDVFSFISLQLLAACPAAAAEQKRLQPGLTEIN